MVGGHRKYRATGVTQSHGGVRSSLLPAFTLVSKVNFPTLQESSKAPEQFFSLECQKKKKKGKGKNRKNFMETFLWGFVKSFPTPTWSPKLRPEQSLTVLPL